MDRHLFVIGAAFLHQMKRMLGNSNYLVILIGAIPTTAMLAAIASGSGNPAVVSYIAVGAGLMIVWNSAPSRMGWLISAELWAGTLELNLISRSPFMLTLFGKSLAVTIFNTLGGLIAFGTVLIVSQDLIEVSNLALIPGSLFFAMLAIISAGFVFAPLFILGEGVEASSMPLPHSALSAEGSCTR